MYCYAHIRKKGTLEWKALREDGKILVFDSHERVRESAGDMELKIIPLICHPMNKRSPIYRKKYKKVGW